jgi:Fic family protein
MHQWIWQQTNWPGLTWNEATLSPLLSRARKQQGHLLGAARLLDKSLSLEAQAQILVEDGFNTSAIEGEQMDMDSIRSSVARHLGLSNAGLPHPSRSVDGLIEVLLDATRGYAVPLSVNRLCRWQAALFPTGQSGLFPVRTGALRGDEPMRVVSGAAGREKTHFEAPPRDILEHEVDHFIVWFNAHSQQFDGLLRAGLAHLWFVTLHPFEDGNGRIARALTDLAICQDEQSQVRLFSLSAQIMRERNAYYEILEKTQCGGLDVTLWLAWFLEQVSGACEEAEATLGKVLDKAKFWLSHQHLNLNERQRKVLNKLLDAGTDGFQGGMNTRKYVSLTRTSRATAYRELADLVEKNCLSASGAGRSVSYQIRQV